MWHVYEVDDDGNMVDVGPTKQERREAEDERAWVRKSPIFARISDYIQEWGANIQNPQTGARMRDLESTLGHFLVFNRGHIVGFDEIPLATIGLIPGTDFFDTEWTIQDVVENDDVFETFLNICMEAEFSDLGVNRFG